MSNGAKNILGVKWV